LEEGVERKLSYNFLFILYVVKFIAAIIHPSRHCIVMSMLER